MEGGPLISIMDPLESDRRIWGNLVNLKNLAEQIWGNPEDSRPTCRVTHFLVCYKFFQRWHWYSNPYPNQHFLQNLDLPRPGQCNWEQSAATPATVLSWRTAQAARLRTIQWGGQTTQQVQIQLPINLWRVQTSSVLVTIHKEFSTECAIKDLSLYIMNKILKVCVNRIISKTIVGFVRDCLQWDFKDNSKYDGLKLLFSEFGVHPPRQFQFRASSKHF